MLESCLRGELSTTKDTLHESFPWDTVIGKLPLPRMGEFHLSTRGDLKGVPNPAEHLSLDKLHALLLVLLMMSPLLSLISIPVNKSHNSDSVARCSITSNKPECCGDENVGLLWLIGILLGLPSPMELFPCNLQGEKKPEVCKVGEGEGSFDCSTGQAVSEFGEFVTNLARVNLSGRDLRGARRGPEVTESRILT